MKCVSDGRWGKSPHSREVCSDAGLRVRANTGRSGARVCACYEPVASAQCFFYTISLLQTIVLLYDVLYSIIPLYVYNAILFMYYIIFVVHSTQYIIIISLSLWRCRRVVSVHSRLSGVGAKTHVLPGPPRPAPTATLRWPAGACVRCAVRRVRAFSSLSEGSKNLQSLRLVFGAVSCVCVLYATITVCLQ